MTGTNNPNQSSNLTNLCNKYNDAIHKKKPVKIISNLEEKENTLIGHSLVSKRHRKTQNTVDCIR